MLLADDKPIRLGGRAFDLLMALIETPAAIVSRMTYWLASGRDGVVTETNLQTQIWLCYERFTEGFATCDLVEARSLLDALHRT